MGLKDNKFMDEQHELDNDNDLDVEQEEEEEDDGAESDTNF